ncbi:hypothetical protein L7G72_12710 [Xenorhabdus bovienii]|uniref:hypothetical protein n=1 Tax=Xenorhabdus bovienii TaxID=40576 RepID=UPI001EDCD438|nr:hypothetical protein [Xenorhabdus bovienii]MCG3462701.1 hypothetical protein [Xenorhabdus bovienii]
MHIETSNVVKLQITDVPRHDAIHVYLGDFGNGRGRITIAEFGFAWTAFWSSMGCSLSDFIIRNDNEYLADCLSFDPEKHSHNLMDSRLNAVKEALRRLHVHTVEPQP